MKLSQIEPEFVDFIPDKLQDGKLYVCLEHGTVAHRCCCGCGFEVNTPLTPTDWKLSRQGNRVTLHPSIGNSSFPCKSHYWILGNIVKWETKMTPQLTALSRARDKAAKERHFGAEAPPTFPPVHGLSPGPEDAKRSLWKRLRDFIGF